MQPPPSVLQNTCPRSTSNFTNIRTPLQAFSCEFQEIFQSKSYVDYLRMSTSKATRPILKDAQSTNKDTGLTSLTLLLSLNYFYK